MQFEYTDEYIKKGKYLPVLGFLKLGILCSVLWLITQLTKNSPRPPLFVSLGIIIVFIFLFFKVIFRLLGETTRDFSKEQIYIEAGLLHFKKCFKTRLGTSHVVMVFKDITKVEVTEKRIRIGGNIVCNNGATVQTLKEMDLPAALKNKDELVNFVQSKINTNYSGDKTIFPCADLMIEGSETNRQDIWNVINRALGRLGSKALLIELISFLVGLLCYWRAFDDQSGMLVLLTFFSMVLFGLTLLFTIIYLAKEYALDFLFKRLNHYTGYLSHFQTVSARDNSLFLPLKHYQGYHHVLFYNTPEVKDSYPPFMEGDIKSDPVEGRRFLVKDPKILEQIGKNQKVDVIYLPKSKIIVELRLNQQSDT